MKVDLLEIKSGNDYKKHSALSKVSAVENWKFGRKIVFCKGNVQKENEIEYLPWYMVMFYETEQQPKEFIYEEDLSALLSRAFCLRFLLMVKIAGTAIAISMMRIATVISTSANVYPFFSLFL